ncbi:hypothetical protein SLA2020_441860 [Shorea laevis]
MNTSTSATSPDIHIDINYTSGRHIHFHDEPNQSNGVPLLLQPSYARSKSITSDELHKFRISLRWCALDHSSCIGKFISYFTFIFFAVLVPLVACFSARVPASAAIDDRISFNKLVQLPESGLTAIAFFTLSGFFRRYGLRKLLFLDGLQEDSLHVQRGYTRELDKAFGYLACILLPSFFRRTRSQNPILLDRDDIFALSQHQRGIEFHHLQILRFKGLHKMFERSESDSGVIFKEHARIRKLLLATSHRYRLFIIACMVTITLSQFVALLLVLSSKYKKTFFNSGDLVVCSAVQLSGFLLCLLGAARITHRAQGIVSVATTWQMAVTCESSGSGHTPAEADGTLVSKCSDSTDHAESSDIFTKISPQDPSLFQTRHALVTYLQHNTGGITLFGFALDRGLLHTLFAFEFSLMLWILSKVVVLS